MSHVTYELADFEMRFRTNYHDRDIDKLSHGNFSSIKRQSQSKLRINQCAILEGNAQVWSL